MDFVSTPLLQGLEARLRFDQARQKVIANNIANADTPNYQARKLDEPNFSAVLGAVNAGAFGHLTVIKPRINFPGEFEELGSRAARDQGAQIDQNVSETKPNGNTVNLEQQLIALGKTQSEYAELSSILRKQIGLYRIALGHPGGR